jgi:hypothetical protein
MARSAREEGQARGAAEGKVGGDEFGFGDGELEPGLGEPGLDRDQFGGKSLAGLEALAGEGGAFLGLADGEETDLTALGGVFAAEAGAFMVEGEVGFQPS